MLLPAANLWRACLKMDELTLEIGFQLIPLVDEKQGGQMLNRVRSLRRHLATELGFVVPPVHITDNLRLKPREYTVSLRGIEIARWQTEPNCVLAVNSDPKARALPGLEVKEPAFGVTARWIQRGLEDQALAAGYSVVDQTTVIGTHLGELIRRHAHELLGRQEVKRLLDTMNESHPKLVEELVPKLLTLGEVQRVLLQLLREQVSIRDLGAILEVLVEAAQQSKNIVHLVESVRQGLGRGLVHPLLDADGGLRVLMIEQNPRGRAGGDVRSAGGDAAGRRKPAVGWAGGVSEEAFGICETANRRRIDDGAARALMSIAGTIPCVPQRLEPFVPKITVLAPVEIPPEIRVRSVGTLG